MSKLFSQFQNYCDFANSSKNNPNLYFFIKDYAFGKVINFLNRDPNLLNEKEKNQFDSMITYYKQEKSNLQQQFTLKKEEYTRILENFYDTIDFDNANLYILTLSRDLAEIVFSFPNPEDLWNKRSIIFIKLSGLF
jgi:hypothetical protein